MKLRRMLWILPAALLACADYGAPDEVVYGTVVYTQPRSGFDFSTELPPGATYYLDTTMNLVSETGVTTAAMPAPVQTAIRTNLGALGYVEDASGSPLDNADVGLKMSVLVGDVDVFYPGYWCGYWYWYYCGYGGWYYAGSYTVGMAILEMGDIRTPPADPGVALPIVWSALMYGVAYDSTTTAVQRVADATNRAFAQSQYLSVQ